MGCNCSWGGGCGWGVNVAGVVVWRVWVGCNCSWGGCVEGVGGV